MLNFYLIYHIVRTVFLKIISLFLNINATNNLCKTHYSKYCIVFYINLESNNFLYGSFIQYPVKNALSFLNINISVVFTYVRIYCSNYANYDKLSPCIIHTPVYNWLMRSDSLSTTRKPILDKIQFYQHLWLTQNTSTIGLFTNTVFTILFYSLLFLLFNLC